MNTLIACLVLAAGTILQPPGRDGTLPAQPAGEQVDFSVNLADADLLNFTDPRIIPDWATKPENRNAALGYLTAHAGLPDALADAMGEIDWDKVPTSGEAPELFTKAVKALHDGGVPAMEVLLAASSRDKCDFELSYEGGVSMLMPHLSMTRGLARTLRLDARHQLLQGRADKAAQRVTAMFRLGAHVTNDRLLISTLVGNAITALATQEANVLVASGKLPPADAALLRAAIAHVVNDDPFNGKASLMMERDLYLKWFEIAMSRDAATAKAAAAMAAGGDRGAERDLKVLKGDSLAVTIARAREGYDEIIAAWGSPDASAKFAVITARVGKGDFGVIAQVAMPSFEKAWTNVEKQLKDLAALDEKLAAIGK